ncbi:MAG: Proteasome subunit beta [Promethearchaeota archaeon]|nr:MAG: Proteasome subunit beta [Candidatus Lokiarchaeota archaeon]
MINKNVDIKKLSLENLNEDTLKEILKTGTTTVGLVYQEGVIIGTESQATAGYVVASKEAQKLFEINKYTAATISGGVADAQYVINQLQALSRLRQVEKEKIPEPKYIANICRNILFSGRSYYLAMMIIGGYSMSEQQGQLYGIDLLGTLFEDEKFMSFGSGSTYSLGVLEADWKPGLSEEAAISLMKSAITSSRERDIASGFKIQLARINKDGLTKIQ